MASAYLNILPRAMIWFFKSCDYLIYLINIEGNVFFGDYLFWFFVWTFYGRITHPKLEKPDAQNIAVCENQGKQFNFSEYWKPTKTLFLTKRITGWLKTTKLTKDKNKVKDFTSYSIRFKNQKKKGTQLNKSTNQVSSLIRGQNNLIKFVESNKFDIM